MQIVRYSGIQKCLYVLYCIWIQIKKVHEFSKWGWPVIQVSLKEENMVIVVHIASKDCRNTKAVIDLIPSDAYVASMVNNGQSRSGYPTRCVG